MSILPKIIAVDFDGTLFENAWPDVGAPIEKNINKLKAEQADGAKVILWEQWSNVVDASPLRGGHPGGQIGQVYGIVEFRDGVRRVDPSSIKFCDEKNAVLCEMSKTP